ncbi:hypothetical protein BLNAU_14169 [Blattamonas nauphoetae]|uniref:Uncharacterized protein n=1 Tax=Blattamonas nauphoetae TaxID=2049346 RepID=A0ABQ9XHQ3_9EUKA|nr:hypothetical protein BLNAU_14169 [Blattamonas nauphoetae]
MASTTRSNDDLSNSINQLDAKLSKDVEDGKYLEAEHTRRQLVVLGLKQRSSERSQLIEKHRQDQANLKAEYDSKMDNFKSKWDKKLRSFETEAEQKIEEVKKQATAELESTKSKGSQTSPRKPKPSQKLQNLRLREKHLAAMQDFYGAQSIKLQADQTEKDEYNAYKKRLEDQHQQKVRRVERETTKKIQDILAETDAKRQALYSERGLDAALIEQRYQDLVSEEKASFERALHLFDLAEHRSGDMNASRTLPQSKTSNTSPKQSTSYTSKTQTKHETNQTPASHRPPLLQSIASESM